MAVRERAEGGDGGDGGAVFEEQMKGTEGRPREEQTQKFLRSLLAISPDDGDRVITKS